MASYKVSITENYACLASDLNDDLTEPAPDPNIPGAKLHVTDEGDEYVWDGTNWIEDLRLIKAITEALS